MRATPRNDRANGLAELRRVDRLLEAGQHVVGPTVAPKKRTSLSRVCSNLDVEAVCPEDDLDQPSDNRIVFDRKDTRSLHAHVDPGGSEYLQPALLTHMRILVADDSSDLVLLCQAVLEDAGYEVVTATTGIAAIAAAEATPVDAAVLDVLMPGMSGDAIAARLRTATPKLPILLVTGQYGEQFVVDSPVPVLRKPFSPDQLVQAVKELFA
jgi:CheY-like chemotaxis protein